MSKNEHIGFKTKELCKLIDLGIFKRCMDEGLDEVPVMNGWIIGYLKHHKDSQVGQKDLENRFHMPKSTLTGILQIMEKRGLIERVNLEGDARRKYITMTEEGEAFSSVVEAQIQKTEEALLTGVDPDELAIFQKVLAQMTENAAAANQALGCKCSNNCKEEK